MRFFYFEILEKFEISKKQQNLNLKILMRILFFIRYSLAWVYAKTAVRASVGLISRGLAKTDPVRIPDQALEELVDKNLTDDEILAKAAENQESPEREIARSWLIDDSELEEESLRGSDKGPVFKKVTIKIILFSHFRSLNFSRNSIISVNP